MSGKKDPYDRGYTDHGKSNYRSDFQRIQTCFPEQLVFAHDAIFHCAIYAASRYQRDQPRYQIDRYRCFVDSGKYLCIDRHDHCCEKIPKNIGCKQVAGQKVCQPANGTSDRGKKQFFISDIKHDAESHHTGRRIQAGQKIAPNAAFSQ